MPSRNPVVAAAQAAERRTLHAPRADRIAPANRRAGPSSGFVGAFGAPRAGRSSVFRASTGTPGIAPAASSSDNRRQECIDVACASTLLARESGWEARLRGS